MIEQSASHAKAWTAYWNKHISRPATEENWNFELQI